MASRARQLSKLLSSDLLTVDVNNNRIGVNSTAPVTTLDVVGQGAPAPGKVRISDTDTALSDGELSSAIEFAQNDDSDPNSVNASIRAIGDGSIGNLALAFHTGQDVEKVRITSAGRVGIGTDGPIVDQGGMHIHQSSAGNNLVSLVLQNHGTTANTSNELKFVPTDASPDDRFNSIKVLDTTGNNQFDTTFLTCEGATPEERLRITSSGQVGIGTDDPTNKLHVLGSHTTPQIKIQDSENGNTAQISLDGVNSTLNFDWVSGAQRDIHFLNTGYTTAGGQGGISVGVGTTNGRRIAGFTINADGGNANSHTAFAVKAYQNNNFLRIAREGTSADGSITISNNYERTGGSEYTPDNVNVDRTCITLHRSNGLLFRHSTQDGSSTYSSAPTIRLTVDENGIDVNGSISKDSGSFRIPHPLAGLSTTNDLVHSFVEAPDASNLYAGMVDLVNGTATVNIDTAHRMTEGTFVALNHVQSWSSSNESGYSPVKCSISGNLLTIECQDTSSTDTVYYEVRGIRKDQHMIDAHWTDENGRVITEPLKKVVVDDD